MSSCSFSQSLEMKKKKEMKQIVATNRPKKVYQFLFRKTPLLQLNPPKVVAYNLPAPQIMEFSLGVTKMGLELQYCTFRK